MSYMEPQGDPETRRIPDDSYAHVLVRPHAIPGPTARTIYLLAFLSCLGFVIASVAGWNAPRPLFICVCIILGLEMFTMWVGAIAQVTELKRHIEEHHRKANLN